MEASYYEIEHTNLLERYDSYHYHCKKDPIECVEPFEIANRKDLTGGNLHECSESIYQIIIVYIVISNTLPLAYSLVRR